MKDRLRLLKLMQLIIDDKNSHADAMKYIIQWLMEIEENQIAYSEEMKNSLMKNSFEKFTR